MTKLKMLVNKPFIGVKEGEVFEVDKVVVDSYRIKVPMKQKGKFYYALIKDDEGELV